MKIDLSNSEVHTLIDMLSLAKIVADWDENEEISPELEAYLDLKENIFAQIKSNGGYDDLIEYVEESEEHVYTQAFEANCSYVDFYNDFQEETFWQEFVGHIADRDLIRRIGEEKFDQLGFEKYQVMVQEYEQRYWQEVEKNGLLNFHLIHPHGS
jgi:hypothetical protein